MVSLADLGRRRPCRYGCLARGARAVLQMYPENAKQAEMLTSAAMRAGFTGGLVVDFPNSAKAKKYFLVLMVGQPAEPMDLQGLDGEEVSWLLRLFNTVNSIAALQCWTQHMRWLAALSFLLD